MGTAARMTFKEQDDKGLSSALPHPEMNRPKLQHFLLGDFMRFAENAIFIFSTRSRRKSKFEPIGFQVETVKDTLFKERDSIQECCIQNILLGDFPSVY